MTNQKNKSGAGKFFFGALLGGIGGVIAGRCFHKNEEKIKQAVEDKIDDIAEKAVGCKEKIEDNIEDAKEKIEKVTKVAKTEAEKVTKDVKVGAKKIEKTAKNA